MYSCVNQPRGCRGRVNVSGGRCESCRQLGLRTSTMRPFSLDRTYKRPSIDFSAFDAAAEQSRQS